MAADHLAGSSWTLLFHGSEVSRVWLSDEQTLHIALSAAAAIQVNGAERTEGHLSGVTLVLSGAHSQVDPGDASQTDPALTAPALDLILGGIAEGHINAQGQLLRQLPAPGHQTGPLSFNLRLISGCKLSTTGHSLQVKLAESAVFRESWAC